MTRHLSPAQLFVRVIITTLLMLLLVPPVLLAQDKLNVLAITDVQAKDYPLVQIVLSATDAQGAAIPTLAKDNLAVRAGDPVTTGHIQAVEPVELPLAIAIVLDLSPAMGDLSTLQSKRIQDLTVQVTALLDRLPADTQISLIAFASTAKVAFPLKADGGGVRNMLSQVLEPPLPTPAEGAVYALGDALTLASKELANAPVSPRAIFIFAAGVTSSSVNLDPLRSSLLPVGGAPTSVTVIGLGSDRTGEYTAIPGDPQGLARLATSLGGVFLPYFTTDIAVVKGLANALAERYAAVIARRTHFRITAELAPLSTGVHPIEVARDTLVARGNVTVPTTRPRVRVRVPATELQGVVRLSTELIFAQVPVRQVEYVLNNIPLGTSTSAPDFAFTFDTTASTMRQTFQADQEYELFAAATDEHNQVNRSQPVRVRLLAPSVPTDIPTQALRFLQANSLLGGASVLVLVVLGGLVWRFRRRKQKQPPESENQAPAGSNPLRDPTDRLEPDSSAGSQPPGKGRTERFKPEAMLFVIFNERDQRIFTLSKDKRIWTIGCDEGNDLKLDARYVSGCHARLSFSAGKLEITDLNSTNGVLVGEEKRLLRPSEQPYELANNAVFWIGPLVQLTVRQVGAPS